MEVKIMIINKGMPRCSLVDPAPPNVIVTPGAKPTDLDMGKSVGTIVVAQVSGPTSVMPAPILISTAVNYLNCGMPVATTTSTGIGVTPLGVTPLGVPTPFVAAGSG
jgi:hypothetical protein